MLRFDEKLLGLKTEVTYGVDSVPTAAANLILAKKVVISPMEGEDVSRELESATLGADGTIVVGVHSKIEFEIEPTPSGAVGVAPAWGPIMQAMGWSQVIAAGVSVTYAPAGWPHGAASIYFWHAGILYKMRGCRGTAVLGKDARKLPVMKVTMWGLSIDPADAAVPAAGAGLAAQEALTPQPVSSANTTIFTINGVALAMSAFSFDLGNKVEPRLIVGREAIIIPERAEKITTTIEMVLLAAFNPYALAKSASRVPLVLQHGVGAGNILRVNAPLCQVMRPGATQASQKIMEMPLTLTPQKNLGNDQVSIVLT